MARNDVSFSAIELKARGSDQYINILEQFQSSSTFGGMSINEGLFDTGISGFIILNDPDPSNTSSSLPSISNLVDRYRHNTKIVIFYICRYHKQFCGWSGTLCI